MLCIFEQPPLVSAQVQVINAKAREEQRTDEDGSLMKKSYGRSRIVLLRDAFALPSSSHAISLPFSKCPLLQPYPPMVVVTFIVTSLAPSGVKRWLGQKQQGARAGRDQLSSVVELQTKI